MRFEWFSRTSPIIATVLCPFSFCSPFITHWAKRLCFVLFFFFFDILLLVFVFHFLSRVWMKNYKIEKKKLCSVLLRQVSRIRLIFSLCSFDFMSHVLSIVYACLCVESIQLRSFHRCCVSFNHFPFVSSIFFWCSNWAFKAILHRSFFLLFVFCSMYDP